MKKNTKKFLIFMCSTIACLAFAAGCGGESSSSSSSGGDSTVPSNAAQAAVTDFAVSAQGIVSFTQEAGIGYTLYRDNTQVAPIESGDDLTDLVTTAAASYSVVKDAREGYDQSPKSNAVTVSKTAGVTDLALTDGKLSYTETAAQYKLVIAGKDIGEVTATAGLDIMQYLTAGANEAYITSAGSVSGSTVTLGAKSNALSVYLHEQVQASIDKTGAIHFNEVDGFTYSLSGDTVEETAVVSGTDISETLNGFAAGDTLLTLGITGSKNGDSYYLVNEENENTVFTVKRYKAPESVRITGTNRLDFDSEGKVLELYVDGQYKTDVVYGARIYQYLKKGDSKISLVVKSTDEAWQSLPSAELTHTLDSYISATFKDETGAQQYMDKDGVTVVGNAGTTISYSETINLKENQGKCLVQMKPVWTTNAFGHERVILRLVDAFDETKGIELVMVNGLKIGYGTGTYFGGGKIGRVSEWRPGNYSATTNPLATFSSKTADFDIRFDFNTKKFHIRVVGTGFDYYHGLTSNFGFEEGESIFSEGNEDGLVKLSVEYVSGTDASGFTFKNIGGKSLAFDGDEGLVFDNDGKWPWEGV